MPRASSSSPASGTVHGLYLMLLPPDAVRAQAAAVQRGIAQGLGLRHALAGIERLHKTMFPLCMYATVPEGLLPAVDEAVRVR